MSPTTNPPPQTDARISRAVKNLMAGGSFDGSLPESNYALPWWRSLDLLSAQRLTPSTGRLLFRYPVQIEYCNWFRILAGGAQTMAHEYLTSYALLTIAEPGYWDNLGLSRGVNVTYFKPARVGDVVVMECEIVNLEKKRATVRGLLRRESDGALISSSEHHMDMAPPPPRPGAKL